MQKTKIGNICKNIFLALIAIFIYNSLSSLFLLVFSFVLPQQELWNHYSMIDTILCTILIVLFSIWFYRIWYHKKKTKTLIAGTKEKHIIPKVIIWVLGFGGLSTIWLIFATYLSSFTPLLSDSLQNFEQSWAQIENESYIWVFLSVVITGPIVEELLFRGIVFHYLEKIKAGYFPILVSGILFGLWHGEAVQVVYTAILGIGFGFIYAKTRDFKIVIIMHILNNFLSTLPPAFDTPLVQDTIFYASLMMVLPTIILFVQMIKVYQTETKHTPYDT